VLALTRRIEIARSQHLQAIAADPVATAAAGAAGPVVVGNQGDVAERAEALGNIERCSLSLRSQPTGHTLDATEVSALRRRIFDQGRRRNA
jgi:hypothetical protein